MTRHINQQWSTIFDFSCGEFQQGLKLNVKYVQLQSKREFKKTKHKKKTVCQDLIYVTEWAVNVKRENKIQEGTLFSLFAFIIVVDKRKWKTTLHIIFQLRRIVFVNLFVSVSFPLVSNKLKTCFIQLKKHIVTNFFGSYWNISLQIIFCFFFVLQQKKSTNDHNNNNNEKKLFKWYKFKATT